jgi:Flp pilus assembly protein TadB
MAQTKRKRRSKHRGTAAGTISARGRTGRPPTADEKKAKQKLSREATREARLAAPPTWKSSVNRALLAAGFMFLFLLLSSKGNIVAAVVFAVIAFALYVPSGYYLERFLWQRRMKKKDEEKAAKAK